MKRVAAFSVFLVLGACAIAPIGSDGLGGLWVLRIRNLDHRQVSVATIRFTDDPASSCIGGNWKRLIVESIDATDNRFFPLSDRLSYSMEGPELIIGRNEVCDGYLHLRGKLEGSQVHGSYHAFGMRGGDVLGDFTLNRLR